MEIPPISDYVGKADKRKFTAARADRNQPSIVDTFRKLGCMVQHTHMVGGGCFDLMISIDFLNIWVEVKDGNKVPSARTFTDPQKRWNFGWTGLRAVVTTDFEAQVLVHNARKMIAFFKQQARAAGVTIEVTGSRDPQYNPSFY